MHVSVIFMCITYNSCHVAIIKLSRISYFAVVYFVSYKKPQPLIDPLTSGGSYPFQSFIVMNINYKYLAIFLSK